MILLEDIKKNLWGFLVSAFSAFAVSWTVMEALIALLFENTPSFIERKILFFGILILGSLSYALVKTMRVNFFKFNVGRRKFPLTIKFGDLFTEKGFIVIPSSRYFESGLKQPIFPKSLQAQLRKQFFQDNLQNYQNDLDAALQGVAFEEVSRSGQPERYYDLGTVAYIRQGERTLVHLALTETEAQRFVTDENGSTPQLVEVLTKLWKSLIENASGTTVSIPLIGSGVSGINLSPKQILYINLLVIAEVLSEPNSIQAVNICLHKPSHFEEINLKEIADVFG